MGRLGRWELRKQTFRADWTDGWTDILQYNIFGYQSVCVDTLTQIFQFLHWSEKKKNINFFSALLIVVDKPGHVLVTVVGDVVIRWCEVDD